MCRTGHAALGSFDFRRVFALYLLFSCAELGLLPWEVLIPQAFCNESDVSHAMLGQLLRDALLSAGLCAPRHASRIIFVFACFIVCNWLQGHWRTWAMHLRGGRCHFERESGGDFGFGWKGRLRRPAVTSSRPSPRQRGAWSACARRPRLACMYIGSWDF